MDGRIMTEKQANGNQTAQNVRTSREEFEDELVTDTKDLVKTIKKIGQGCEGEDDRARR